MIKSIGEQRLDLDALRRRLRQVSTRPPPEPTTETWQRAPDGSLASLEAVLGSEEVDGCHVITTCYGATHTHAGVPLQALWECEGRVLATLAKDETLVDFDFRRTIFLDTETNGLAGGTGTYAFLVGVAYWDGEHFQVQQFFMHHPSEERALLACLSPLLERFDSFVTFNGKSFDLPILETRYILARQPRRLKARPHLDLLHPARRLWKLRLDSCSLGSLEQRILGAQRDEVDVPGYLIPHLYNTFLRDGNVHPLKGVFYHNHQDLLALAALAVHMSRLCEDPERHAAPHGQDLYSLARLYEETGQLAKAEQCYRRSLTAPVPPSLRRDGIRRLSFLLKRQERWEEATKLWRSMIGQGELYPYVELAKYHEHRSRNLPAAERAVLAALEADLHLTPSDYDDLQYRLARVQRKLKRES
ncbi:MAG: ribonuclease H-like domain-containing protein [Chloroflexota bacterium]|nr:ribonuclease H-like domain-containing protein [Chloroflexota bacterium]